MRWLPILVNTMNPRTVTARDAGLALVSRINRWMIAGAIALSGVISLIAQQAFHGHTVNASNASSAASNASNAASSAASAPSSSSSGSSSLQQPAQAPAPAPSSSSSSSGGVVSGGS